jgi:hypothetical protein
MVKNERFHSVAHHKWNFQEKKKVHLTFVHTITHLSETYDT